jgi:hypothetical protein
VACSLHTAARVTPKPLVFRLLVVALLGVLATPAGATPPLLRQGQALRRATILENRGFEVPDTITPGKRILVHATGRSLFKPPTPQPPHQIPAATDHLRERAFFVTAAYLGLEAPATALRRVDGKVGSVQEWLTGEPASSALLERSMHGDLYVPAGRLAKLDWDSVHAIAVLDYVTNNRDRHWGNLLVQKAGDKLKLVPIDNGLSFAPRTDWELKKASYELAILGADHGAPRQLSEGLLAKIRAVDERRLARHLRRTGLEPAAVSEAMERLAHLKREGLLALARHSVSGLPEYMTSCGLRALLPLSAEKTPRIAPSALPVRERFSSVYISTGSRW